MKCRGIRGATTCTENSEASIVEATRELLEQIIKANAVIADDVAAMFFTCSPDLTGGFPAKAARELGYGAVPLFGGQELSVPGAPTQCVRVLLLVNTDKGLNDMKHIYLRGAKVLRPEFAANT